MVAVMSCQKIYLSIHVFTMDKVNWVFNWLISFLNYDVTITRFDVINVFCLDILYMNIRGKAFDRSKVKSIFSLKNLNITWILLLVIELNINYHFKMKINLYII